MESSNSVNKSKGLYLLFFPLKITTYIIICFVLLLVIKKLIKVFFLYNIYNNKVIKLGKFIFNINSCHYLIHIVSHHQTKSTRDMIANGCDVCCIYYSNHKNLVHSYLHSYIYKTLYRQYLTW